MGVCLSTLGLPLVAQMVKNLPARQETRVGSLGQEDPREKGMATHSSILAWRISWTEEPGRLQSMNHKESEVTSTHMYPTVHIKYVQLIIWQLYPRI